MPLQPVRDTFVTTSRLTHHYVQWGEQGTPIICAHGLTANAFFFQAIAEELARDHRVFAYDLRGRGLSDQPEHGYSVPIHAADLSALIEALEMEQPIILGHSLGALVALYFAANYPTQLSKLILVDGGAPLPWQKAEDQPAWLAAAVNRLGVAVPSYQEYIQRLKAAPFLGPYWNEFVDIYFEHDVAPQSDGSVISRSYREGILEEGRNSAEARPEEQWGRVQVPTLILRAGQGLVYPDDQLLSETAAAAMQQAIKNSQFRNFPTLNHYTVLFNVEPEPVEAMRTFIA
ncbi:alpha/beta fold hydrolase [Dictyobacter kobayashii]|uniref:Alpha/beta hydrolase n=1 Tax=Dictyobacter kobayashii TaxID=2014872 RepID=A0A402AHL9_9CHLR|nr:alpha/beta hydrolase [Dictyobacter kobayashii]GCE18553.1 alpha/beta hydrolase [Dictyobacter kobayashii]